jgi:hypothetical protein
MVRKEWKPREGGDRNQDAEMKRYREEESDKMDEDDDDDDDDDEEDEDGKATSEDTEDEEPNKPFVEEDDPIDLEATPRMLPRTTGISSPQSLISTPKQKHAHAHLKVNDNNVDVTGLVNSLDSLSLVPDSIRFGRGGKISGFVPNGNIVRGRGGGRGRGRGEPANSGDGRGGTILGGGTRARVVTNIQAPRVPVDSAMADATAIPRGRGRGRGGRARSRGRGL